MNIDIQWAPPFQFQDEDGMTQWRREWLIPYQYRNGFFKFWGGAKFKLKDEGFSVRKEGKDWFLVETKLSQELFRELGRSKPKVCDIKESEEFWVPPYEVRDKSGLRPWQVGSVSNLVSFINKWGTSIDGSDLGVGKSYVACAVARELDMKITVVCPKAVKETWRRVICNHFNMKDSLTGIINYEQLRTGKKESPIASYVTNRRTHRQKFTWKISKNNLIIWDESQKLKNWKTKNAKTCVEAIKQQYKMLFCSATNATNPLELRTVGTALQLFKGAKQYYEWLYQHGVSRGNWGLEFTEDKKLADKVLKKLHKDIFVNRGVRLTRDTIPNFPECDLTAECYDMDEEDVNNINSIHDEMEKELKALSLITKRDSKNRLTAELRARQQMELVKVPLFIEMIEEGIENGMSVVVFVNFTETINALSKRLNTKCIFDGKVGDVARQKSVDDFQANKERIILVNIQSGGSGLSLHDLDGKYPRLALISPSYSPVLMRQSTGRVWRDDAKSKSFQKIVFVARTIEESVCENVQRKLKNLDTLNDGDLSISSDNGRNEKYEKIYETVSS